MKIIDCEQGTPEWFAARANMPTASCFDMILTATGKKSSQVEGYINELCGDWLAGASEDTYTNEHMARGTEMEPVAREYYEFTTGNAVAQVGFCTNDAGTYGCSPDGLVDETRGLEIKCPARKAHVGYMRGDAIPTKYKPQVQGCMLVTERDTWDWVSYHPNLPSVIITIERDDAWCRLMREALGEFLVKLDRAKAELVELGYAPASVE